MLNMWFLVMGCFALSTYPKLCYCTTKPIYDERYYQKDYTPEVVDWHYGKRVVAPDTPYIAAVGPQSLYFIDKSYDSSSAAYIKEQLEHIHTLEPEDYFYIDEVDATAEVKEAKTHTTKFKFNPAYARVFFAEWLNRKNATLDLPVHEPAGDWLVNYEIGGGRLDKHAACDTCGCETKDDCVRQTDGLGGACAKGRVDNDCALGTQNGIGICGHPSVCLIATDTPKFDGEADADYYKRMDRLHWQHSPSE